MGGKTFIGCSYASPTLIFELYVIYVMYDVCVLCSGTYSLFMCFRIAMW